MMSIVRTAVAVACGLILLQSVASPSQRRKKKEKDESYTQTLEVLPDPPATLFAETARLSFYNPPMTAKGLLSQQVKDALKAVLANARGSQVIKLRAFVSGTGDLRRVQSIVSEVFSDRRLKLPVLSVVQVGSLGLDGAQLRLEATIEDSRKAVNKHGVAFVTSWGKTPQEAMSKLKATGAKAGASGGEFLRVSCFVNAPDYLAADALSGLSSTMAAQFPKAQWSIVQAQRLPAEQSTACDGAARLSEPAPGGVQYLDGAVAVSRPKLVFAGAQLAFRYQEGDARLAFQRLEKTLEAAGTSTKRIISLNTYPLSPQLADMVRKVCTDFLDAARPPATTLLPFEGLPSMDASFGLEAVALADSPGS